ncbi:hypothetical protein DFJ73DRAFT_880734 [Zopfochytrium polystomum]|nr:hypothetical protein DFJ73DRAFT_880734 [Zopfochytrium polystomum]
MTGVEGDDAVDESHDGGARGTSLDTQYTQPPADADAVGAAVAAALQGGLGDYAGALGRALLDDAMAGWRAEFLDAVTRAVISIKSVHGGTVAALLADCRVASAEAAAAAAAAAYSQSRHGATHEKGDGGQRDGEVQSGAGGDTDEGDADGPSSMTACMMELLRLVQAVEDDGELASVWMKGMGSCPAAWGLSLSVHFRVRHLITLRLAVLLLDVPPYMAARLLLLFS